MENTSDCSIECNPESSISENPNPDFCHSSFRPQYFTSEGCYDAYFSVISGLSSFPDNSAWESGLWSKGPLTPLHNEPAEGIDESQKLPMEFGLTEFQNLKPTSCTLREIGIFKDESEPDDWSDKVSWDEKVLDTKSNQKKAHNAIEKRYRHNLNKNFQLLKGVLPSHQDGSSCLPSRNKPIKSSRATILEVAYDEIINLRERVSLLEGNLQTLRKAAFPDTCHLTLHHP